MSCYGALFWWLAGYLFAAAIGYYTGLGGESNEWVCVLTGFVALALRAVMGSREPE